MAGLIAFVAGLFGRYVTASVLQFVAYKALLLFAVTVILPAVLLKLWFVIKLASLYITVDFLADYMLDGFAVDGIVQLTGIAGYLGEQLKLAQGVSILISCAIIGWVLRIVK